MKTVEYREATAAVQKLLRESSPGLIVDGKFGRYTQAALSNADSTTRARIDAELSKRGLAVGDLVAERARRKVVEVGVKTDSGDRYISTVDAKAIASRAASDLGMGAHASAVEGFLDKEAARKQLNGVTFYDVRSQNGSSRGLMQMQPAAWADARKVDPSLPGYESGVFDAEANIRAGVAYTKRSVDYLVKRGIPVNADTLYLAHNQGLGFFSPKQVITNRAGQSKEVQALIDRYTRK